MKYWFTDENTRPLAMAATACVILLMICCVWFALIAADTTATNKPDTTGLYPLTAVVEEINGDVLTLVDGNGNGWEMTEDGFGWMLGDVASLLMYDNGTETVEDDIILDARFSGWVDDRFC